MTSQAKAWFSVTWLWGTKHSQFHIFCSHLNIVYFNLSLMWHANQTIALIIKFSKWARWLKNQDCSFWKGIELWERYISVGGKGKYDPWPQFEMSRSCSCLLPVVVFLKKGIVTENKGFPSTLCKNCYKMDSIPLTQLEWSMQVQKQTDNARPLCTNASAKNICIKRCMHTKCTTQATTEGNPLVPKCR